MNYITSNPDYPWYNSSIVKIYQGTNIEKIAIDKNA